MPENLTDEQVVALGNDLAAAFALAHGRVTQEGFRFYEAQDPRLRAYWHLAAIAFEHLRATDLNDALTIVLDEQIVQFDPISLGC